MTHALHFLFPLFLAPVADPAVQSGAPASGRGQTASPASSAAEILRGGVSWRDFDGDGRLDALSIDGEGRLRLLGSRAEAGFEDLTESAGLGGIDSVHVALWGDYDGDGRADLFVGRSSGASLLLRNEGASFVDMAAGAGLVIAEPVLGAHWMDEDGDGRLDLHVATASSSTIWRGVEGGFFEPVELPLEVRVVPEGRGVTLPPVPGGPAEDAGEGALAPGSRKDHAGRRDMTAVARPELGSRQPMGSPPLELVAKPLPYPACSDAIRDQANPGSCLTASSEATLGRLYPLSIKLFVSEATGRVGVGTTSPLYPLHVNGKVVSGLSNSASGLHAAMSGGRSNQANGDYAAVGGGRLNLALGKADTIGGGWSNATEDVDGSYNTIGGGLGNTISGYESSLNTIGGGLGNSIGSNYSSRNTIAGGSGNYAGGYGYGNTVGGGLSNSAYGSGGYNTVGGGLGNIANGLGSTVSGGRYNHASGDDAVVPGGRANAATGDYSFAAGRRAKANHSGSFVWGDGQDLDKASSAADEFSVYAEGGMRVFSAGLATPSLAVDSAGKVGIGTATPADALHVEGIIRSAGASGGQVGSYNPNNQNASVNLSWLADVARIRVGGSGAGGQNGLDIQTQSDVSLMRLLHNGNVGVGTTAPSFLLEVDGTAGKPGGGSWSVSSDARLKKDVEDLEGALATLLALRGVSFEYIDPASIGELEGRRIGFLAQEVERVVPDWVAEKENGTKYLTIRGFEALAVEALRELSDSNVAKDARIAELEQETRTLAEQGGALEARVVELEGLWAAVEALQARLDAPER